MNAATTSNPDDRKPAGPWYEDGAEIDRYLDGELDADTVSARRAEAEADPARAGRIERRASFLAALADAGAQYRERLAEEVPPFLGHRAKAALARDARRRPRRWMAAAAVAAIAFGAVFWTRGDRDAHAMPPEVLTAAEAARVKGGIDGAGLGSCLSAGDSNPADFPLVKDGSLRIVRCEHDGTKMVATLHRPEDLPSVGYVAVADDGARAGPTIGMTEVGEFVVYDLAYGRQHHYLAVSKAFLDRERKLTPGREGCRACHNRSREGKANPHNIVKRSWQLGG